MISLFQNVESLIFVILPKDVIELIDWDVNTGLNVVIVYVILAYSTVVEILTSVIAP